MDLASGDHAFAEVPPTHRLTVLYFDEGVQVVGEPERSLCRHLFEIIDPIRWREVISGDAQLKGQRHDSLHCLRRKP
jgi:hypothetical protein